MHIRTGLLMCLAAGVTVYGAAAGYQVVREIQIGGEGGWDYVLADAATHRLYVSHATKIVVAETETGAIVGEIPDTPGVHGFAIAPELGRGFTSNGRANSSTIVDLKTLSVLGTVPTGANPDSIRYLPDRKEVWTFNHTGGSVTVFDAMSGKVITTIEVGGTLEEAVEDATASRVYVNVEDKGAIAVIDTKTHGVVANWPVAGCEGPTALAFDAAHHLLLTACDGRMVAVDSKSGSVVTSFPIAGGVDGNGFDPATGLAFASSGTGVLTIAHEDAPDRFTVVETVKTQPSGRTMYLDPVTHRVYVPVATTTRPPNGGRAQVTPGTMKVLVVAPG
ncbi:PQQ-dependent catabolism-associated beta-propeller protein [Luteitalea pratensis]|uniref:PQQ-dependent catabolism-associated beta-propeller protein n=1 Tax=Luteitalea pratensis TaxID=1855912 RepID=A0A143PIH1_LUTPR|nr:YncE family protein [Luteitalea pratensis]AMY08345.1 PQQ-dependent catabolism-associated beta-propeller protein [Luteitalea pratensis]